jgi:hypothetical protein
MTMRFLTRSGSLAAVNAEGPQWIVPARLAVGVLLLCPVDGSIQQLFTFYHEKPSLLFGMVAAGTIPRAIEILAGLSFVAGLGTRLAGYPTMAIFAVRAVADLANSSDCVLLSYSPRLGRLTNQWASDHAHTLADGTPILALDMYEHSYHIDFGPKAAHYVDAFMQNINWTKVATRFDILGV